MFTKSEKQDIEVAQTQLANKDRNKVPKKVLLLAASGGHWNVKNVGQQISKK
jgi:hypothetical protein